MSHYARLDENSTVVDVIVVSNNVEGQDLPFPQSEPYGIAFCKSLFGADTNWAQTSYNGNFRYNYAGIGYTFDPVAQPDGAFIPVKPYPSWLLNTETYQWTAPVPYPSTGGPYMWDEETQSWVEMPLPPIPPTGPTG